MIGLLIVVCLATTPPDESFDGVSRDKFGAYLDGPGKELGKKQATSALMAAEVELKAIRNAVIDRRVDRIQRKSVKGRIIVYAPSRDVKEVAVKAAEMQVDACRAALADPPPYIPKLGVWTLEVGKVGRLRGRNGIYDEQEFVIIQVINENNCIAKVRSGAKKEITIWLDQSTAGMVDGECYSTHDAIYEVIGTTTYNTVIGGTNTIFRLRRTTIDELRKVVD